MNDQLVQLAKATAQKHGLDPVLVCAICEQESNWDPWAIRFEPRFMVRYVQPLGLKSPTEVTTRSISWGLMQLMGESARELGFTGGHFLSELCDPAVGLEWGCKHLIGKFKAAGGDVHKALLYWNGGGNPAYPDQVLARMTNYA